MPDLLAAGSPPLTDTLPVLLGPVRLEYRFTAAKDGPAAIRVETAPGLDVRGRGQHRYAVSVDGGPLTVVDLLAGANAESWGKAVADNRRVGTTPMTVSRGPHTLSIWLVDPPVVFTAVSVMRQAK